jgi:hypothetical protein
MKIGGDEIYWVENGASIQRALYKDGSPKMMVGAGGVITRLAVDATQAYWKDGNSFTIYAAKLDGTGMGPVVTGPGVQQSINGLAVAGGELYFASNNPNALWRAKADGSQQMAEKIAAADLPNALTYGPGDVVVDATYLYWTDYYDGMTGSIRRMQLSLIGTPSATVEVVAVSPDARPLGLVVDTDTVYWRTEAGTVYGCPKAGCPAGAMIHTYKMSGDNANALAVDGAYVYWVTTSGAVVAAPKSGQLPTTIATVAPNVVGFDLPVDCGALYVSTPVSTAPDGGVLGGIYKVGKLP